MHVDEARSDDGAVGVEYVRGAPLDVAEAGDAPVLHRNVGGERRAPGPVDEAPAADHQVPRHADSP
jgi:hypothetical protein